MIKTFEIVNSKHFSVQFGILKQNARILQFNIDNTVNKHLKICSTDNISDCRSDLFLVFFFPA